MALLSAINRFLAGINILVDTKNMPRHWRENILEKGHFTITCISVSELKEKNTRCFRNVGTKVVLAIPILLLFGCSGIDKGVAPSNREPWIPPARESASRQSLPEWKLDVGEVLLGPDTRLDLPMLLDIAFENSPMTKKSWQAARISAAQNGKVASVFFPRVKISGVVDKMKSHTPGPNDSTVENSATTFYPAIELQCSVFNFGGHAKSVDAARHLLYAANYQHNRALQTLARDVQRCYFALDSAESAVEASEENLRDALIMYDAAFIRYESGLSNIKDFLQAKVGKSRAEFELEEAKSQVESARAALAGAIGVPVSANLKIARNTDQDDIKDLELNIQDLIAETVHTRQDVLALNSVVMAHQGGVWASSSKLFPELVIGASGNRKSYQHKHGQFDNYDIYAALQWTVFDGFSSAYDLMESKAKLKVAEQDLRQKQLLVASEVWSKYHAFKSAKKQLNAARNYEQASRESFDSMLISYKNGLASTSDLMAAQTQLAAARKQTVICKNNLCMSILELAYAVGISS
jgi:outer membrane protein TolC